MLCALYLLKLIFTQNDFRLTYSQFSILFKFITPSIFDILSFVSAILHHLILCRLQIFVLYHFEKRCIFDQLTLCLYHLLLLLKVLRIFYSAFFDIKFQRIVARNTFCYFIKFFTKIIN